MNSKEEVLKMVKDGILSVDEATKLLNAMEKNDEIITMNHPTVLPEDYQKKMLKIYIQGAEGDVVRINVPVAIVITGIDIASKFGGVKLNNQKFDMSQIDFEMIKQCIQSGMLGEIVNIESSNGDVIKISIE